jgi:hypothetical protein
VHIDDYASKDPSMTKSQLTETGKRANDGDLLERQASGKYASVPNAKTKLDCAIEAALYGRGRK